MIMAQGTVKWFNDAKGYGFITLDSGEEIFVHHTAIKSEGHRTLVDGENVSLEVVKGDKGPRAADVVRVSMAPEQS
jgi:cold shock protein